MTVQLNVAITLAFYGKEKNVFEILFKQMVVIIELR
jgi:hypothetical protein